MSLVHFIFSTHNRMPSITPEIESDLHAYIGGITREIGGVALCVNRMPDHLDLLVRMPTTHSTADVARLVKTNSSRWVHERGPQNVHVADWIWSFQCQQIRSD